MDKYNNPYIITNNGTSSSGVFLKAHYMREMQSRRGLLFFLYIVFFSVYTHGVCNYAEN